MRKGIALFTLWLLVRPPLLAQTDYVVGQVLDKSGEPVPFAHIRIEGTYSGTLTNIYGNFQLNVPERKTSRLVISCVGYVSKTVELPASGSIEVTLEEGLIRLQEVVIVPKDYARELVASAVERIPENYPSRDELITGFIRETLSKDSLADSLHYISEAQTEASKSSYLKATSQDEVKLIKGRKLDVDTDNLGIRIYAGAHLPHRFDLVMRREGPLNPKKMRDYIYEVDDTVRFANHALYRVGYLSKNGHESGTIAILEESHAIVSIEQLQNKDKFKGANLIKDNSRQYLKTITNYNIHEDSLWRLNYIRYSTMFINGDEKIYLNSLYTTHGFKEEEVKIPYAERIQFGDFLMEQVSEFDPDYWTDYNVTLPDQKFDKAYQERPEKEETEVKGEIKRKTFLDVLLRMEFNYNIRMLNTNVSSHSLLFNSGEITVDETLGNGTEIQWVVSSNLSYKLTDRSLISFESSRSFGRDRVADRYLGYTYRLPLGKGSRTSIAGSFGYNYTEFNKSIGQISLNSNTTIAGKRIDAEKVDIYSSTNFHSLVSSLSFIYEKSRRLKFILGVDHFIVLDGKNGLMFREDQGIFRRKTVLLENGDEGLDIDSSSSLNFERDWGLKFGFIIGF